MKNIILSAVAVVILGFFGGFIALSVHSTPQNPKAGALAGPDLPFPYFSVGGLQTYKTHAAMAVQSVASTTLCAILLPTATSTLSYISWQVTTGTSTSAIIDVATSTSPYATTTSSVINTTTLASGATGAMVWFPTAVNQAINPYNPTTGGTSTPEYLIFKTEGLGLGGYTLTGTCNAETNVL